MSEERTVISIANVRFEITDPQAVANMPDEYRQVLILSTADDIATVMMMEELNPIIVPVSERTGPMIDERKRGLKLLGVEDVEAEINAAIERLKAEDPSSLAKRALPFMRV